MRRQLGLSGLLLLAVGALAQSITTIELQNRPAAEVIPIIQPMLGPADAISGQGFTIFLKAPPDTVALVRQMVDVVDAPAKIVQVSVFQGSKRDLGELALSASIRIESGNASVEVGPDGDDDAADGRVTYSTADGTASVNAVRTQGRLRDNPIHQVRVVEGTEAYIHTGSQIPYFVGGAAVGRRVVAGGIEYQDARTGFYALPRVRGENVVLEVSAFKNSQSTTGAGNIDTQSATTTVTGRLGEWLLIGGMSERIERTRSATGTTIATRGGEESGIWIKADLVE